LRPITECRDGAGFFNDPAPPPPVHLLDRDRRPDDGRTVGRIYRMNSTGQEVWHRTVGRLRRVLVGFG